MQKFFKAVAKPIRIMKILGVPIIIILSLATLGFARESSAQELMKRTVTAQFSNREITKALTVIGHKTNVKFTYLPGIFPPDAKVSVKVKNESLENVPTRAFGTVQYWLPDERGFHYPPKKQLRRETRPER